MKIKFLTLMTLVLGALAVEANEATYMNVFTNFYTFTRGTRLSSCLVCHTGADPTHVVAQQQRNPFGVNFQNNTNHFVGRNPALALQQIQSFDSDGDGYANITEINALTFPGNAGDFPSGPSATLSSPASGTSYGVAGTVTLTANAFAAAGVASVQFYKDNVFRGSDSSDPYQYQWTFTAADNGPHVWMARAIDTGNHAVDSTGVTLTVDIAPPNIVTPPVSQIAFAKTNLQLFAASLGSQPLHYQWFFKNRPVRNATNTVLSLPNISLAKSGDYFVVVTNYLGRQTSALAHVQVILPVVLKRQPVNKTVIVGRKYTLRVLATGTRPLLYQWTFNGGPIPNATNASLSFLPTFQPGNAGTYAVTVHNVGSTATSTNAVLSVPVALAAATVSKLAISARPVGHGLMEISLAGGTDGNFQIEVCDDGLHWQPLPTVPDSGPAGMVFDALDSEQPNRLYRAVPARP